MKTYLSYILCKNCLHNRGYLLKSNFKTLPTFTTLKNYIYIFTPRRSPFNREIEEPRYPYETAYVQIVGSGARGAPRCMYLVTDSGRYMFNCGEGTQRLGNEYKLVISRTNHVFITHTSWENTGGLIGHFLTIQGTGKPEISVYGPPGIDTMFAAISRIVILNRLEVKMIDCSKASSYEDPSITISSVPLIQSEDEKSHLNDDASVCSNLTFIAKNSLECDHNPIPDRTSKPLKRAILIPPKKRYNAIAMSYICKLKTKLDTFSLELCVQHGVPPGPLLGKLKKGEDITLPNGKIVKFSDVNEPLHHRPVFIVMECPSISFLDSLLEENEFKRHQTGASDDNVAKYVFHFTPSDVMIDEKYQIWMKRFPDTTLHVNLNDSNTCLGHVSAHLMQLRLNYLDPDVFPLLKDRSISVVNTPLNKYYRKDYDTLMRKYGLRQMAKPTRVYSVHEKDLNIPPHVGHTLKIIDMQPFNKFPPTGRNCVYMNPKSVIEDLYLNEEFHEHYELFKSKLSAISDQVNSENAKNPFPIVTFLGTGSSVPSNFRNTSGILITFSEDNHMIMDCAEGTYNQIVRHFGADEADRILAFTKAIYISHLHPDHHMGAIYLLKKRIQAVNKLNSPHKKVYLLAPKQIAFWFYNYHLYFEPILDSLEHITNQDLQMHINNPCVGPLLKALNVKEIKTVNVRHCPFSFGISVVDSNNRKITYSGDTAPTNNLVKLGMNSDLLIHEGTYQDNMKKWALSNLHSTFSEAITMGKRMNAKFTILTHFSQRYWKIPLFNENFDDTVGVAFDNMRVRLGDLRKLPLYKPILEVIFHDEIANLKLYLNAKETDDLK